MHAVTRLLPEEPALAAEVRAVYDERGDLREAYADPSSPEFVRWVLVNGPLEYPERIGRFFSPIPPQVLRQAGSGGPTAHWHLYSGIEDFEVLHELWASFGSQPLEQVRGILDFGCGCGRVLRWFEASVPDVRRIGSEIRPESVAWCRHHLSSECLHTSLEPRLELEDDAVEFVYAVSVFAHLSRDANLGWLRELVRVCAPGGCIMVSTLGASALFSATRRIEHREILGLDVATARSLSRRIRVEGFLWRPVDEPGQGPLAEAPTYDRAFLSERFVADEWLSHVSVLAHVPAAQEHFQDWWILRPK